MNWLNRPYPLLVDPWTKLIIASVVGGIVYLFLLIYQPFGVGDIKNKEVVLIGFGVSVFASQLFTYFLFPYLFPRIFDPETWIIKKEVLFHVFSFLLISLFNYCYNTWLGPEISPQYSYWGFIFITTSIGIFPLLLLLYFTEKNLLNKNKALAVALDENRDRVEDATTSPMLSIVSPIIKEESLTIPKNDFLFAQASSNYCNIHYLEEGKLKKYLMRISLKNLMEQLELHSDIIRCHKSYIINKLNIKYIDGNARSLHLKMQHSEAEIPVSRSFPRSALKISD